MADFPTAVLQAVDDALFGPAGAPTLLAVLLAINLWLSAQVQIWSDRRHVATGLRVTALLTVLAAVVANMHRSGWLQAIDTATATWMVEHRSGPLNVVALLLVDVTGPVAVAAGAVMGAALVSRRARSVVPGAVILATVAAAGLVGTALTALLSRPHRPLTVQLMTEVGRSFPALHVIGFAALLGILGVCVADNRRYLTRLRIGGAVAATVAVIAATRVYSATHWVSEAIAGTLVAAVLVSISAAVLRAWRPAEVTHPATPAPVVQPAPSAAHWSLP